MKTPGSTMTLAGLVVILAAVGLTCFVSTGTCALTPSDTESKGQSSLTDDPNAKKPVAPDFELQSIQGETVRLSDYRGKAVLLNFWATWCAPCRKEIPDLIELTRTKDSEKFVILGMTLQSGSPEKVRRFAEQMGMNYPVLVGPQEKMMQLAHQYGDVRAIPTTFLIGPDGRIQKRYLGPRTGEVFWQDIQSVLHSGT